MQLLFSSPVPQQQFASLSLLLPPGSMAEPLICVSPTCTFSKRSVKQVISDLHTTIRRTEEEEEDPTSTSPSKKTGQGPVQTLRSPQHSNLAIQYSVVRGSESLPLQTLVQSLHLPEGTTPIQIDPSAGVMGVVLAVAVTGHEALYGTSPSVYALPQRIQDCLGALSSSTVQARPAALRLLHAYLLTSSPDERATNEMVAQTISFPAAQEMRGGGVLSPMMMAARHHRQDHQPPPFLVWDVTASEPPCSAVAARNLLDQMTVLSVAQDDAAFAAYQHSAQERKAQLDVGGRFRRRKADDADLEGMDYKGPVKSASSAASTASIAAPRKLHAPPATEKLRSSKKDTKVSTRSDTASTTSSSFDPFRSNHSRSTAPVAPSRLASSSEPSASSTTQRSSRQLQINFALNEDLACSYKLSQLASCSVEGVVQIQVKSNSDSNNSPHDINFHLLLRDTLGQVDSLTENRKFVTKEGSGRDYRFHISVPKTDTYFPLLKYKCMGDLRPVPIRVQTKVKTDGEYCRVALQISSNPNNTAPLSDLTIMLGVPPGIDGESLTSQPTGGVWEPSKSSVLWCVSELNSGEKFQLQARFAMDGKYNAVADGSQFPVLVRCQSLQAQLSEVVLEARSVQDTIATKIARRYRVSHREKNG